MFTPTVEHAKLVNRLTEALKNVPIGETFTWTQVQAATGMPVEKSRNLLAAAIRKINISSGIVFSNVKGVGYQRLPTGSVAEVGRSARQSIGRKSRRARKTITNSLKRTNDVSSAVRLEMHLEIGLLGLAEMAVRETTHKRLASAPPLAGDALPAAATLAKQLLANLQAR